MLEIGIMNKNNISTLMNSLLIVLKNKKVKQLIFILLKNGHIGIISKKLKNILKNSKVYLQQTITMSIYH